MKKLFTLGFWMYAVMIILIAVLPVNKIQPVKKSGLGPLAFNPDYFLHACMFLVFYLIFFAGEWFRTPVFERHARRNLFLVTCSLAVFVEAVQFIIPNRAFYLLDMASNLVGVAIGMALAGFINAKRNQKLL
jgi:hypothetical protein